MKLGLGDTEKTAMDPELKREIEENRQKTAAVERAVDLLNQKMDFFIKDMGQNHAQNRRDIHAIRDVAQTTGEKVWLAIHNIELEGAKQKGKMLVIGSIISVGIGLIPELIKWLAK